MQRGSWLVCARAAFALFAVAVATTAHADAPSGEQWTEARAAYERGQADLARDDFDAAAREFERADDLVPSDASLVTALRAASQGSDATLAARLLTRAARRPALEVRTAASVLEKRFGGELASLRVVCPSEVACTASVDGAPVSVGEASWLVPGSHVVGGAAGGVAARDTPLDLGAGSTRTFTLAPPPPAEPQKRARAWGAESAAPSSPRAASSTTRVGGGLSPTWFWIGAGATAVLAGVSLWSTADVLGTHHDFADMGCGSVGNDRCRALAADGKSADTRTAILWGATGVALAATVATGLLWVRWRRASVGVAPIDRGTAAVARGAF